MSKFKELERCWLFAGANLVIIKDEDDDSLTFYPINEDVKESDLEDFQTWYNEEWVCHVSAKLFWKWRRFSADEGTVGTFIAEIDEDAMEKHYREVVEPLARERQNRKLENKNEKA